jgi:hypothetical protein
VSTQLSLTFEQVKAEKERYSRQAASILALLRQGPQVNTALYAVAINASARISELRRLGHKIEAKALGGGLFRYELVTA